MKKVKLLDCTLRDGGYINNWNFWAEHIQSTVRSLENARVDILEVGFLRNIPYDANKTNFSTMDQFNALIPNKKNGIKYAAMIEAQKDFPIDSLPDHSEKTIDIVRVMVWKDMHDEQGRIVDALHHGYDICKQFADKGYEVFVQPVRVEQYSDKEFVDMVNLFNGMKPSALYIVDSWGTMYSDDVLHYAELADKHLTPGVAIGLHGHNNLMQAFQNGVAFAGLETERELIVDTSVYGIGRGAGNLNSEIFAKFLNEKMHCSYEIAPFFDVYENTVKKIYERNTWGYAPNYYMTAMYHANPQYATYYINHGIPSTIVKGIMENLSKEERIMYNPELAEEKYHEFLNRSQS